MLETTTTRHNPLIDPDLHVWHGEVAVYLFLGGVVAGLMVLSGVLRIWMPELKRSEALKLLPWTNLVLLSIGMLCLWLDLSNRFNAWRFYIALRPISPMSWGAWILLLVYPISAHFAWADTRADWRESILKRLPFMRGLADWSIRAGKQFGVASIVVGSLLGIYTGILLGAFSSRPLWNSALLGPLFMVSGLSTAAAFLLLFKLNDDERRWIGLADMILIISELGILGLWIIALAAGGGASQTALGLVFGGPWTAAFWSLVIGLGLLVPLFGEWLEHRQGAPAGRGPAILVLIGGLSLRWIMVYAGQHSSWVEPAMALGN